MTDTAFITCLYLNLQERGYNGSPVALNRRYFDSLKTILKSGTIVYCYTDTISLHLINNESDLLKFNNLHIIVKELEETYRFDEIQSILKDPYYTDTGWAGRNPSVMYGKILFCNEVILNNPTLINVYWIDAGLLHGGLFPVSLLDDNKENYFDYTKVINSQFVDNANLLDSVLFIRSTMINHGYDNYIKLYGERPYYGIIAGFFGGKVHKFKSILSSLIEEIDNNISKKLLLKEEEIMYYIHSKSTDVKTFTFDNWYHPDWPNFDQSTSTGLYEAFVYLNHLRYHKKFE